MCIFNKKSHNTYLSVLYYRYRHISGSRYATPLAVLVLLVWECCLHINAVAAAALEPSGGCQFVSTEPCMSAPCRQQSIQTVSPPLDFYRSISFSVSLSFIYVSLSPATHGSLCKSTWDTHVCRRNLALCV